MGKLGFFVVVFLNINRSIPITRRWTRGDPSQEEGQLQQHQQRGSNEEENNDREGRGTRIEKEEEEVTWNTAAGFVGCSAWTLIFMCLFAQVCPSVCVHVRARPLHVRVAAVVPGHVTWPRDSPAGGTHQTQRGDIFWRVKMIKSKNKNKNRTEKQSKFSHAELQRRKS